MQLNSSPRGHLNLKNGWLVVMKHTSRKAGPPVRDTGSIVTYPSLKQITPLWVHKTSERAGTHPSAAYSCVQ